MLTNLIQSLPGQAKRGKVALESSKLILKITQYKIAAGNYLKDILVILETKWNILVNTNLCSKFVLLANPR